MLPGMHVSVVNSYAAAALAVSVSLFSRVDYQKENRMGAHEEEMCIHVCACVCVCEYTCVCDYIYMIYLYTYA